MKVEDCVGRSAGRCCGLPPAASSSVPSGHVRPRAHSLTRFCLEETARANFHAPTSLPPREQTVFGGVRFSRTHSIHGGFSNGSRYSSLASGHPVADRHPARALHAI